MMLLKQVGAPTFPTGDVMDAQTLLKQAAASAALSIEFVAKPEEAHRLGSAILTAVQNGLGKVPGFAGCLVMISDREARLVSVVTFWTAAERMTCSRHRERWVHDLLAPHVDHCLRVRTLDAYLTALGSASGEVVDRECALQVKNCSEEELPLSVA
jgi:hypothetical protein